MEPVAGISVLSNMLNIPADTGEVFERVCASSAAGVRRSLRAEGEDVDKSHGAHSRN